MDEWAIVNALRPHEVALATGERGSVPQEHRNSPAAWVAQRARTDEAYRELMKSSKRNVEHDANAYVCFSGTLEQHHAFDWTTRCFVSRLSPVAALRKTREYFASARPRTAPLVVERGVPPPQTPEGVPPPQTPETSKVSGGLRGRSPSLLPSCCNRSSRDDTFRRRSCAGPYETIDAWMTIVRDNAGGAYTRKANVVDVMDRIKNSKTTEKSEPRTEIGGASLRVN